MTPEDKKLVKAFGEKTATDIVIGFASAGDNRDAKIQSFCDELAQALPQVQVKTDRDTKVSYASMIVEDRIFYQAIPEERELEPFLKALFERESLVSGLPQPVKERLDGLKIPCFFKVYITPGCPFCPTVVTGLLSMALYNEQIRVTVIDGALFPEPVQKDNIASAPTVLLDDQFRWTGTVNLEEIAAMAVNRDPAELSPESLQGMIEDGNAEGVAKILMDSHMILPAYISLMVHDTWPVRLGAMVAFETLVDENPDLAKQMAQPLWERFADADDGAKGDILHVIGESGDTGMADRVKDVFKGGYSEEVKEAAEEALEKLEGKSL